MTRLLMITLMCLTGAHLYAQSDIDRLLDRNIFDPDRGKKPEEETEEPEEVPVEVVSKDMPVLDGTLIIGETKIALFTYLQEGQPVSARVRVDEKVAGYTVQDITTDGVTLQGGGQPMELALFSGQKENRGGSRSSASVARTLPGQSRPVNAAQLGGQLQNANEEDGKPTRELPNAREIQQQRNQRFNRRNPPNQDQRRQKDANSNKLGRKF